MRVFATAVLLLAAPAAAQTFPSDSSFVELPCHKGPMTDRVRDEPGAIDERDLVGDADAPAGLRAIDASFLYLRLRLDADPTQQNRLRAFAWGVELDLDGVYSTYEILIIARGNTNDIALHRNTTTTLANDPNDPANAPPIAVYPFSTHGRSVAAASRFGNNTDYFLDLAIPWSDLRPLGVTPITRIVAWAGTSSTDSSLNTDLACFDNATGEPTLSGATPDPTVPDPVIDSDGDGFSDAVEVEAGSNPNDPQSVPAAGTAGTVYEGGGGCATGGGRGCSFGWLAIAALILSAGRCSRARSRRRRDIPSPARPAART